MLHQKSFISALNSEQGLLTMALKSTNDSIIFSKSRGLIASSVPLTDSKELSKLFGAILIMAIYRFPHYKLHFTGDSPFIVGPLYAIMQEERFQILLAHFSFGSQTDIIQLWENFTNYSRQKNFDLAQKEALFLKKIDRNPFDFTLLYDENGSLLDGVVEIRGNLKNYIGLMRIFSIIREKQLNLISNPECNFDMKVGESTAIMIIGKSKPSKKMEIKGSLQFDVLIDQFEFLEDMKKNEIKTCFLLLEHLLMNFFYEKTQNDELGNFCEKISKELLGVDFIEKQKKPKKIKKNQKQKIGHFPEKMFWCKKCRCCQGKVASKGKNIKKTKYKCMQCSFESGRDVALCLDGCFQEFHHI